MSRLRLNRASRRDDLCPACLDRNALSVELGRPIFHRGAKLTGGCEICGGTGRVISYEVFGAWPTYDRTYVIKTSKEKRE